MLADLQKSMVAALTGGDPGALRQLIRADGLAPEDRLSIHRNNVTASLVKALEASFPVSLRLVGRDFFRAAAAGFVRKSPPRAPCLSLYGGGFPDFLQGFGPARKLPYLPDVARLEWARIEASTAADASVLAASHLSGLPEAELGALRLPPHPAARLLVSRHPIYTIWSRNQPDWEGPLALPPESGPETVLVTRPESRLVMRRTAPGAAALFRALSGGATLARAAEAAFAAEPGLALDRVLAGHIAAGSLRAPGFPRNPD
jgi:hypothetical protein